MIQVLNKAINILELLSSDATREFPLAEIASSLEMDKGTCANILKTLRLRGYGRDRTLVRSDTRTGEERMICSCTTS